MFKFSFFIALTNLCCSSMAREEPKPPAILPAQTAQIDVKRYLLIAAYNKVTDELVMSNILNAMPLDLTNVVIFSTRNTCQRNSWKCFDKNHSLECTCIIENSENMLYSSFSEIVLSPGDEIVGTPIRGWIMSLGYSLHGYLVRLTTEQMIDNFHIPLPRATITSEPLSNANVLIVPSAVPCWMNEWTCLEEHQKEKTIRCVCP